MSGKTLAILLVAYYVAGFAPLLPVPVNFFVCVLGGFIFGFTLVNEYHRSNDA